MFTSALRLLEDRIRRIVVAAGPVLCLLLSGFGPANVFESPARAELPSDLAEAPPNVCRDGESLRSMWPDDVHARLRAADRRSTETWERIHTRAAWELRRQECVAALKAALGEYPEPAELRTQTAATVVGDGYRIQNLVYQSRPGVWVTANFYLPHPLRPKMPGLAIVHSHHNAKTQSELIDMGLLWARAGCAVLIPDQLGHGERRQHPFSAAEAYPEAFQTGRQDYYFRYVSGMQLHAAGESLAGWMAFDLIRGMDVLTATPGVDGQRLILLGSVAGGGDPAAVTAAIDPRIAAVVPFNFGGPQPETRYPLPENAAEFRYSGSGSWESTRNLTLSARNGFLPWEIVASVAPRKVIHAHEFRWDQDRDPVWKRYQTIFGFFGTAEGLAFTHGFGAVTLSGAQASHCNNIGPVHRRAVHAAFDKWFGIQADESRITSRPAAAELRCVTAETAIMLPSWPTRLTEALPRLAAERSAKVRDKVMRQPPALRRVALQDVWKKLLDAASAQPATVEIPSVEQPVAESRGSGSIGEFVVERWMLSGERQIRLPLLLIRSSAADARKPAKRPAIVCVSQQGKAGFLKHRSAAIGRLAAEATVCLVDVRATGESRAGDDRGRRSEATAVSSSELMLGTPLLGGQVRDVRTVLAWLRQRPEIDASRLAIWGDSFQKPNTPDETLLRPLELSQPEQAEPLGALAATLAGLFEPDVKATVVHGGIASYGHLLREQTIHVPHDALVPGAASQGDWPLVLAVACQRPLWISGTVDSLNRPVANANLLQELPGTQPHPACRLAETMDELQLVDWLLAVFRTD